MLKDGGVPTWSAILEAMDDVEEAIGSTQTAEDDPQNMNMLDPEEAVDDDDLVDEVNKLFTPVLVMQGFENDVSDRITNSLSEAAVLTEKSVIQFDNATRMSQLISVCALLLAKNKNTDKWQAYKKAANIRNKMKLDIQKEEYEEAKALAQKYLVKVSTTNNSSVARDAANSLLPETQH